MDWCADFFPICFKPGSALKKWGRWWDEINKGEKEWNAFDANQILLARARSGWELMAEGLRKKVEILLFFHFYDKSFSNRSTSWSSKHLAPKFSGRTLWKQLLTMSTRHFRTVFSDFYFRTRYLVPFQKSFQRRRCLWSNFKDHFVPILLLFYNNGLGINNGINDDGNDDNDDDDDDDDDDDNDDEEEEERALEQICS